MEKFFIEILNLSISGSFLILAVCLLRLIFKKAPKTFNLICWALVFFKLILPIKIESNLSLAPSGNTIPQNILYEAKPNIDSGFTVINNAVNPIISESLAANPGDSVNPIQVLMLVGSNIWLLGALALLIYAVISFILLKIKVKASIKAYENVYYCDYIDTPFVLGVFDPKIFLPSGISENEAEIVIMHEKAHIKRFDHLTKILAFVCLSIHWFNPLVWLSYHLFSKDIEAAADEYVVKDKDALLKKAYSETLLNLSIKRRILVCPLAFGEIGVKERVKSILNFKRPTVWAVILSIIICILLAVFFIPSRSETSSVTDIGGSDSPPNVEVTDNKDLPITRNNWYEGITLSVTNNGNVNDGIDIVFNIHIDLQNIDCKITTDNKAKLYIFIDDEWIDYGRYQSKTGGYNVVHDNETYYINKDVNQDIYHAQFETSYGMLIPGRYMVVKQVQYTDFTKAESYGYSAEFTITEADINIDKDSFEYISNFINFGVEFTSDLAGELCFDLKNVSDDFKGTLYTDGSVKLEIQFVDQWYDYGYFMQKIMGYDYAIPEYQYDSVLYSLSFSEESKIPSQFKIAVPFNLGLAYGDLETGNYRISKTLYYESEDGVFANREYSAEFAIID